jgi:hypothetical protein
MPWMVWQLNRMRVGVFNTYQRLARAEVTDAQWEHRCPFCRARRPEDLAHFLLECPTWARQRGTFIVPILRKSKVHGWLGNPARRNDLVHILIGGNVGRHHAVSAARKDKKDKQQRNGGNAPAPAAAAAVAAAGPAPAGPPAAPAAAAAPLPPLPPNLLVPVPDVPGHVAPPARQLSKCLRTSGLNWLVGVGRYLAAVWPQRTAEGPPLSRGRLPDDMAALHAPGGGPAG